MDAKEQARLDWVKGLKAGDTVGVYCDSRWTGEGWTKHKVAKVTPTGQVILDNEQRHRFDKFGCRRENTGFDARHYLLVPWTEDIDRTIRRKEMVGKVRFYLDRDHTDLDKVNAMADVDLFKLLGILRTLKVTQ